jgi:hypothetical protein
MLCLVVVTGSEGVMHPAAGPTKSAVCSCAVRDPYICIYAGAAICICVAADPGVFPAWCVGAGLKPNIGHKGRRVVMARCWESYIGGLYQPAAQAAGWLLGTVGCVMHLLGRLILSMW